MKVVFSFQKDNSSKPQRQNITFEAGLTSKIMQEIQQADVLEISSRLAKKGIPTDFKGNQVVAWCCDKTVGIFEQLNKEFGTKLALPKGIFVENFERLNINNPTIAGFCNPLRSSNLIKGSNIQVNGETLFFNTFEALKGKHSIHQHWLYDWTNIDSVADYNYSQGSVATDHFLDVFMHEFFHVAHEDRLLHKIGEGNLERNIDEAKTVVGIENYRRKYGLKISKICNHALSSPLEAIACDTSRTVASHLDEETLVLRQNPFIGTPYERLSLWKRINIPYYTDEQRPLTEILRNFWNGKFD